MALKGELLLRVLGHGLARVAKRSGAFCQVSGLSYTYDPEGPVGGRIIEARIGDADIRPERYYRVALPSFILSGGDGFTMFEKTLILHGSATAPKDVVVLADYCRKLGRVDSRIEGRITVLSSSADTRKTGN